MAFDTKNLAFKIAAYVTGSDSIKGLTRDVTGLKNSAAGIQSSFATAGNAIKGIAASFAVREVVLFTKSIIDMGDELYETSQRLGISAELLSKFKTAAELNGTSLNTLEASFKKFSTTIVDTANGSKEASAAFRAIGVNVKNSDGTLKESGNLLLEISDKFLNMKDGAEKAAIAQKIFGKSALEIIPFLNQGSKELQKYGVSFDSLFTRRADNFNDNVTILSTKIKQFSVDAINGMLPALTDIVKGVNSAFGERNKEKTESFFKSVGNNMKDFAFGAIAAFKAFSGGLALMDKEMSKFDVSVGRLAEDTRDFWSTMWDAANGNKNGGVGAYGQRQLAKDELQKKKNAGIDSDYETKMKALADELMASYNSLFKGKENLGAGRGSGGSSGDASELAKIKDVIGGLVEKQKLELDLLELENRRVGMTEEAYEKEKAALQFNYNLKKETKDLSADLVEKYREEAIAHQVAIEKLQEIKRAQEQSYGAGAQASIKKYVEESKRGAKLMEEAMTGAFSKLEDSLVDFVKTGKISFSGLADHIITEMIRISIRQSVIAPILGAFGNLFSPGTTDVTGAGYTDGATVSFQANGGIVSRAGEMSLSRYARGGIASSPQLAMFGEGSMPEAYVPLPDGRSIPVSMKGGSAGGGTNVSVVVNMTSKDDDSSVEASSQFGNNLGKIIANVVRSELITQRRPGGLLT